MRAQVITVVLLVFAIVLAEGQRRDGPVWGGGGRETPSGGNNGRRNGRPSSGRVNPTGYGRPDPVCLRHENHYASQERNELKAIMDAAWRNERVVPDVVDCPPQVPLTVQYGNEVIHPGRRVSMTMVRQRPTQVQWLADPNSFYTIILPDVDIENSTHRNNAEFFNWLVVNIPGNDIAAGETLFDYLALEVVRYTGGHINHRYAYLVYQQPGRINFDEPISPSCGPGMFSSGRGPRRLSRDFARQYNLQGPVAGTFVYVDWDEDTQDDILCEWRDCNNGDLSWYEAPLDCTGRPRNQGPRRQY